MRLEGHPLADRTRILAAGNVDKVSSMRRIKRSLPHFFAPKSPKREELKIPPLGSDQFSQLASSSPMSLHRSPVSQPLPRQCRSSFTGSLKQLQVLPIEETFGASDKLRKKRSMPHFSLKSLDFGNLPDASKSYNKDAPKSRRSSRQHPPPLPTSPQSPQKQADRLYPPRAGSSVQTTSRASSLKHSSRQGTRREQLPLSPRQAASPQSPVPTLQRSTDRRCETLDAVMVKNRDRQSQGHGDVADQSTSLATDATLKGWKVIRQSRDLCDAQSIARIEGSKDKHEPHCPLAQAIEDPWKLVEKVSPNTQRQLRAKSKAMPPACPVHSAGSDSGDSEGYSLNDRICTPADLNAWLNIRFSLVGESLPSLTDLPTRCSLTSEDRDRQPYTPQHAMPQYEAYSSSTYSNNSNGGLPTRLRGPLFDGEPNNSKHATGPRVSSEAEDDEWTMSQCYHLAALYIEAAEVIVSADEAPTRQYLERIDTKPKSISTLNKRHSRQPSVSAGSHCASFLSADSEPTDSLTASDPETPRENRHHMLRI